MSLRKFCSKRHSSDNGFGSVHKQEFSKGYYVVRFSHGWLGLGEYHCTASNQRIAKKKLDQLLRGELQ